MRNLVIAGTSGFAAEVTQYVLDNIRAGAADYRIKGYLDVSADQMAKYRYEAPLLGSEKEYSPQKDDVFLVATGTYPLRNRIIGALQEKGAKFINLVHHTSQVSVAATLGEGNIICPFSIVGPNSRLGNFNILNYYTAVAHDCELGDGNVLAPYNNLTGWVKVGSENVFGSNVAVLPKLTIGSRTKIQAGTVVSKSVPDGYFCFANIKNGSVPLFVG